MNLVEEIVIFQIERGGDCFAPIAKKFFENNSFYDFSKSQLNNLSKIIENSKTFDEMDKRVKEWIKKQAERKKGEIWERVQESLPKILFEWDNHVTQIKDVVLNRIENITPIETEIDYLITEDNLRNDLEGIKYRLAKRMYNTIMTFHRGYHSNDDELKSRLFNIDWGRAYED